MEHKPVTNSRQCHIYFAICCSSLHILLLFTSFSDPHLLIYSSSSISVLSRYVSCRDRMVDYRETFNVQSFYWLVYPRISKCLTLSLWVPPKNTQKYISQFLFAFCCASDIKLTFISIHTKLQKRWKVREEKKNQYKSIMNDSVIFLYWHLWGEIWTVTTKGEREARGWRRREINTDNRFIFLLATLVRRSGYLSIVVAWWF